MVKLNALPERAIIDGFKGTIDFYMWKSIACARKWPTYRPRVPYPNEAANQNQFAYINKLWASLPAAVQDTYRRMAVGTPWTGKDIYVKCYMSGIQYE
ncbi:hypothetical protein LCGC14_1285790 [marine sediment metagenome]|uniref:Uncharacterized protein n=1 Tax=marine sediment metagenome TaxID=412755 RepID=A0A0F9KTZ8_9ZZZZ